ncbi:MAG TPA: amidohydrolase, partial [Candidatus Acidoferrales bacterium]|nr:amidohydrolase [Candidatus Acidoferrales bacterium]
FLMPGFNDAHVHLASAGLERLSVELVGTRSYDEMLQRIADAAAKTPAGEWLQGRGWDHTKWTEQVLPSRAQLDKVTGDHPAFFERVDGHIAAANSAALQAAGITRATADPAGGKIDRDASGEPTGIVRDAAVTLMLNKIPSPSPTRLRKALELALDDAARSGITSVQDNSPWTAFLVFEDLEREGKLTARVSEWLAFQDDVSLLQTHRAHHAGTDSMLHTGMLKGFMDGSLGSRTAAMLAPYSDDPSNRGLPQFEADTLNQMATERQFAGFQLGFHAIGDGGAQLALDAFDASQRYANTHAAGRDFRNRIEHAQVLTVEQMDRMASLKVIASVQPNHLLTDMNWAEQRIGAERAKHSYPWRELQQRGVRLAFGTDYPVEPITPFRGIYAAVTRKNEAGTNTYYPDEVISREAALLAYTSGSAYAEFAEREKGTLAPGMLADFVVLDRDLVHCAPEEILKTQVLRTVVGGKTVYEAK